MLSSLSSGILYCIVIQKSLVVCFFSVYYSFTINTLHMEIINMTPHKVTIVTYDGKLIKEIPASGSLIRLKSATIRRPGIDGIPFSETIFADPEGLPDFQDDKMYIVSQLVKSALPDRADLLVPAEVVRDKEGNIIGCQSLGI